jgi:hypothetical protein
VRFLENHQANGSIHYLVNALKTAALLLSKNPDRKQSMLTEESWTVLALDLKCHQEKSL